MDRNYRFHVTVRCQNGSVFNSVELCTEDFDGINAEKTSAKLADEIELWAAENINASEEQLKDYDDDGR